ncbi:MAG TPA: thioredoxin family protein [Thermoplasmata archaeon]|nr:thioredoxin family protein [Thermoplasmata archaeon]
MDVLGPAAFDGPRLQRPGTWVVDFSAAWCPFCDEFLPRFASLGKDGGFALAIGDLTDVESALWDVFEVRVTPTMIAFRDGIPVFRRDGRLGEGLDEGDLQALRAALGSSGEKAVPAGRDPP